MLQEQILQTLEKSHNIDQRKLAQVAHVNESSISRYLNGYEEINFEGVLRIVKYLYPEQEREIMSEYIMTQKSKNARYALEYCAMNNHWDLVEYLIGFLSESTNPVDKEWSALYSILFLRQNKILNPMELLDRIETFKPKEIEMRILKSILKAYIYFDLDEKQALFLHIQDIEQQIQEVRSTFIKESFTVRLSLIMNYICLYENEINKSREYNLFILRQPFYDNKKATALNNLGLSYIFESFEKSLDYFNKALNYFVHAGNNQKIKRTQINISFLNTHWNKHYIFDHSLEDNKSLLNYIYYLIQKGEVGLAQQHISKINVNELTQLDQGFYNYYMGLITKDRTFFYLSIESFIHLRNYFHMQLPISELEKLGENEVILRIFSIRGK